jgi:hypothetical protein
LLTSMFSLDTVLKNTLELAGGDGLQQEIAIAR